MKLHRRPLLLFALVLMAGTIASAATITFQTVSGAWSNPAPPEAVVNVDIDNGGQISTIDWGVPEGNTPQSGYVFESNVPAGDIVIPAPPTPGPWVLLGDFTHNNYSIFEPFLTSVDLSLTVGLTLDDVVQDPMLFKYVITHQETPNTEPCPYPGITPCADRVSISTPEVVSFSLNNSRYTLQLSFAPEDDPTNPVSSFITNEGQANTAQIFGRFTEVPEPGTYAMMLVGLGLLALARRKKQA